MGTPHGGPPSAQPVSVILASPGEAAAKRTDRAVDVCWGTESGGENIFIGCI